jgi:hypothetical protein
MEAIFPSLQVLRLWLLHANQCLEPWADWGLGKQEPWADLGARQHKTSLSRCANIAKNHLVISGIALTWSLF